MRDKQQIKDVKPRLRYVYTCEKGLNRGNTYETNKRSKNLSQDFLAIACVRKPNHTYTGFNLHIDACGIHAQGCLKPQPINKLAEKQSGNKNPNSNNQTCSEHERTVKLT